ncbi:MAG: hypothetical protein JWM42_1779 [Burkholderia sp.]|nr:hypothetical protein [Burkholderia sp.]
MGNTASLSNNMLASHHAVHQKDGASKLTVNEKIHAISKKIDEASPLLQDTTVRSHDGWQLLEELGKEHLAIIDPAYWEPAEKTSIVTYGRGKVAELSEEGFLDKVRRYVMPAWGANARLVLTNRYSPSVATSLSNMGWVVHGPTAPSNASVGKKDPMRELVAVNFNFDPLARVRAYVAFPGPERQLLPAVNDRHGAPRGQTKRTAMTESPAKAVATDQS